uniref:Uncharacterized protein n=1 Tax=Anguilla anguilla TaxID=7936 RepID=A0A0E9UYK7_ANGAN
MVLFVPCIFFYVPLFKLKITDHQTCSVQNDRTSTKKKQ